MAFFYRDEKINHEERHFEREKIDVVCSVLTMKDDSCISDFLRSF